MPPVAWEGDTYSLQSQATTTVSITDSLRKSTRKVFTFNIMIVGPANLGKTTLLSGLFGKDLEIRNEQAAADRERVSIDVKTFEIDERKARLKLTVVDCHNYSEGLELKDTHKPLVQYIDQQFADYYSQESSLNRRNIQDRMVHCLFFFISPMGHGLSTLDVEFLKEVHDRVNIVPIIGRAEALTGNERAALRHRVRDELEKNGIKVYSIPDPEPDESDDVKRCIKEIQEAWPFAITSMERTPDSSLAPKDLVYAKVDPFNREHSHYMLLKTMLDMQISDLRDSTHELYDNYRLRRNP